MPPTKKTGVAERIAETWFPNLRCHPSALMEINNLKGIFAQHLIVRANELARLQNRLTIDVRDLQDALLLMSSTSLTTMIRRDADRAVTEYREKTKKNL